MLLPIVKGYFAFLAPEKNPIISTAWMLEGEHTGVVKGYGCVHCRVTELEDIWKQIGVQGPSCHTTLNRTNLKGRKTENIESVRVFCVDLDREINAQELEDLKEEYNPGLIVESSPGRYHIYWKAPGTLTLDRWSEVQLALAYRLQGDYTLSHRTHVIRVPGFKRICKNGQPFIPKIVHESRESRTAAEQEEKRNTVLKFPWLNEAIEAGKIEASKRAREIFKLARKASELSLKGTPKLNSKHFANTLKSVSSGSRNVTLYAAARHYGVNFSDQEVAAYEGTAKDTIQAGVLCWGEELNNSFDSPLEEREARSAILSGLAHGLKARAKETARKERLKSLLSAAESAESAKIVAGAVVDNTSRESLYHGPNGIGNGVGNSAGNSVGNGNGNGKIHLAAGQVVGQTAQPTVEEATDGPTTKLSWNDIPTSVDSAAARLIELITSVELDHAVTRLAAAIELKTYSEFVKYLCEKFKLIGCYRKDGPAIFVKEKTRWNTWVKYPVGLDEKAAIWFITRVVTDIGIRGLSVDKLKDLLKRPPKTAQALAIAQLWWKGAISQEVRTRQAGDIIVFQDGTLDLRSGVFKKDDFAPIKYSHPIWCYYHKGIGIGYAECEEKGWPIVELVRSAAPKFWGYCQEWFPKDPGIVEVLLNWFGYSFTTDASRQKFMFFYGPTRSGKGSLCRTLCALAGWHNYSSSDYSALDGGFKGANMFDKLIITMEETEGSPGEHEKRMGHLKKLIGGERVTFERKYQHPFEDAVIGKFILQANEIPQYQDKGHAIRARMIAVGFEHSFEDSGITVDPAQVILESEADKLATLAALLWAKNRVKANCFRNLESRAIQLGISEVVKGLDIVGETIKSFIIEEQGAKISSRAISELIEYTAKDEEKTLGIKISHAVAREIKCSYPGKENVKVFGDRRGYLGLRFNKEEVFKRYPELLSPESRSNSEILVLLEELGVLQNRTTITL